MLKLGGAIYAKHQSDGAASLLKAMEDFNWAEVGPNLAAAQNLHNQVEEMQKKAEELYRERDLKMADIKGAVTSRRNILKGVYAKNPKRWATIALRWTIRRKQKRRTLPRMDNFLSPASPRGFSIPVFIRIFNPNKNEL